MPYGALSDYMENILSLNVDHLADTYILNNVDDMHMVKGYAKNNNITDLPELIIYDFNVPRYAECETHTDMDDLPDIVANVFMDYESVSYLPMLF